MTTKPTEHTITSLAVTNMLLAVVVVGVAIAFLYVTFLYEPNLSTARAEQYAAEAQERLSQNSEEIQQEVQTLVTDVRPVIADAVYQQAKDDYPRYIQVLEKQGDVYLTNVEQVLVQKIEARHRHWLREHRQIIQEEFPKHATEENVERILNEFEQSLDDIAERYYVDAFRREAKQTQEIWKKFEPAEAPAPGEPTLAEQLANYTADLITLLASEQEVQSAVADNN